jgi:hypothetical protein
MTRSNVYITLTGGKKLFFVLDSSSAPEQGYIVENFFIPLLALNDAGKEMEWIEAFADAINEKRINAAYRYLVDLEKKSVRFFKEHYNYKSETFHRGKELTEERYLPYVQALNNSKPT